MGMFGAPRNPFDPAAMFAASQGMPQTGQLSPFASPATPQAPASLPPLMGAPVAPQAPVLGQGMMQPAAPKKPGFNDPGGWAEKLAMLSAAFGEARGDPNAGMMAQMMAQRRDHADKLRLAEAAKYAPQHVGDSIIHLGPDGKYVTDFSQPTAPHVGPLQQKIDDLRHNGATDAQIQALIAAEANPMTWLRGENGDGTVTMTPVPKGGPTAPPSTGPAPGTIDGGYRFKGGDYRNPSNWEPAGGAGSQAPRTFPGLPRRTG